MKILFLLWFLLGVSKLSWGSQSLCSVASTAKLSPYYAEEIVKAGSTLVLLTSRKTLSSYYIQSIAKAAKAAGNGGRVIVCIDSNDYGPYDLGEIKKAGAELFLIQ